MSRRTFEVLHRDMVALTSCQSPVLSPLYYPRSDVPLVQTIVVSRYRPFGIPFGFLLPTVEHQGVQLTLNNINLRLLQLLFEFTSMFAGN